MGMQFQTEYGHFRGKVGACPFCREDAAELWYEPSEDWKPFQVRCLDCGARGPWADCGEEVAVPAWQSVELKPRPSPTSPVAKDERHG